MCSWFGRSVSSCLRPFSRYARMNKDDDAVLGGEDDALLWSRDLEKHSHGEFSFAIVQANEVLEDQSQVETGRHATFVGVYDGHGGSETARYINDNLFRHLLSECFFLSSFYLLIAVFVWRLLLLYMLFFNVIVK